jgi:hypothetical protein
MCSILFYINRTCGRASTPYRINLFARDIFMHPHRAQGGWMTGAVGSANHLWATTGVSTHKQEHGTRPRQLALWRGWVVGSSRCLRLASAPPWERLPLQIIQALQVLQTPFHYFASPI